VVVRLVGCDAVENRNVHELVALEQEQEQEQKLEAQLQWWVVGKVLVTQTQLTSFFFWNYLVQVKL
jgi:hypothetical protein